MAIDPLELMSPRERLSHNINMRTQNADGHQAPPSGNLVREDTDFFGEDGFGFDDFLDIINPLQHLPLISIVYRELTGDEISPGARVVGGGLFGGPLGAMVGAAEAAISGATGGEDLAVVAWNAITGEGEGEETATQLALAEDGDASALRSAGGEIEVTAAAAPSPWIDPNMPPLPAQTVRSGAASTAPSNPQPPKQQVAAPAGADAAIPELSESQVALLLASVGLQPETEAGDAEARDEAEIPDSPTAPAASLIEPAAALAPRRVSTASRDAGTVRNGLGPMKQTYVRPPTNDYFIKHAPITEEMRTNMSNRSTPLSDADQAWVVDAMAAALDKYRNGKTPDQARSAKGATIDAAH